MGGASKCTILVAGRKSDFNCINKLKNYNVGVVQSKRAKRENMKTGGDGRREAESAAAEKSTRKNQENIVM
jgi:hypothetical protein